MTHMFSPKRISLMALLLMLGLVSSSLLSTEAFASFSTCRTDPTVRLSDGYTIVMYADISDSISDVHRVDYVLHVPAGVSATHIDYDSTGYLESVTVVADQQDGHGYSDTIVYTGASDVSVTAYSAIEGMVEGQVSGTSGQHLYLRV